MIGVLRVICNLYPVAPQIYLLFSKKETTASNGNQNKRAIYWKDFFKCRFIKHQLRDRDSRLEIRNRDLKPGGWCGNFSKNVQQYIITTEVKILSNFWHFS